ncbi:MAG: indole-3-glycerol-phosphate synthase [Deltaproteobacteria bacterium]|jgi:indole-3-glycerol phosphate synthase|nr:indole-3-glycerol-phosphate synthase [Deltaproteobacteria bacterium]
MEAMGIERFREAKASEIKSLRELGREELERRALRAREAFTPPDFLKALEAGATSRGIAVIAEYKRASPSQGEIESGVPPEAAAEAFREADCISVLTEGRHFGGELAFLPRMTFQGAPLLRKDFVFHPLQILDTVTYGASAVLLITRLLAGVAELREFILLARSLGLAPVTEVLGGDDLEAARSAGAGIIQVNARDLDTLKVDFLASLRLAEASPPRPGEFFIAASGLRDAVDLKLARRCGFRGALIGTALMRGGRLRENLAGFMEGLGAPGPQLTPPAGGRGK